MVEAEAADDLVADAELGVEDPQPDDPATTLDIRYGVSTIPRNRADWVSRWSRTAMARAATVWMPMLMITYSTVTFSDDQKMGSWTIRS